MVLMMELARVMVKERIEASRGSPALRRYLDLEFGGGRMAPTAIPVRWTRRRYRAVSRLRRAVGGLLGRRGRGPDVSEAR